MTVKRFFAGTMAILATVIVTRVICYATGVGEYMTGVLCGTFSMVAWTLVCFKPNIIKKEK